MHEKQEIVRHVTFSLYMYLDNRYIIHQDTNEASKDLEKLLKRIAISNRYEIHKAVYDFHGILNSLKQTQTGFVKNSGMSFRKVKSRMKKSTDSVKEFADYYTLDKIYDEYFNVSLAVQEALYVSYTYLNELSSDLERMGHAPIMMPRTK